MDRPNSGTPQGTRDSPLVAGFLGPLTLHVPKTWKTGSKFCFWLPGARGSAKLKHIRPDSVHQAPDANLARTLPCWMHDRAIGLNQLKKASFQCVCRKIAV